MKECGKCGMFNNAEITETSACPDCGAIYAKVDKQLKRAGHKSQQQRQNEFKAEQKQQARIEKIEKKMPVNDAVTEVAQPTAKNNVSLMPGWACFSLGIIIMLYSLGLFFIYLPLFLVAFVLSIIAMTQSRVSGGIVLLLCTATLPALTWAGLLVTNIGEAVNAVDHNNKTSPSNVSLQLRSKEDYRSDSNQICAKNWTKRGELDKRMYDHCMEGQMEGFNKLIALHEYVNQDFYSKTAYPYCLKNWTKREIVDTRMLSHCLNQEVEGIKDVMYYREQYGVEKVNKIADRALSRYSSWRMAAYSVKKAIE